MDSQRKKPTTEARANTPWRGLEDVQGTPEAKQWQGDEFPHRRDIATIDRRGFLKFVGGSAAIAGLASGCRYLPQREIVPYVIQPEDQVTGVSKYFATANVLGGYAVGLLVLSNEGRPTKVEGNPKHPASLGAVALYHQAETMNLYDPERLKSPEMLGEPSSWKIFLKEARAQMDKNPDGRGVVIVTEICSSPALASSIQKFLKKHPQASWRQWEPVNFDNIREGAIRAFGQDHSVSYDFTKANVVLAIDADFMQISNAPARYQHDLMSRRNPEKNREDMSRIYAVEGYPTLTGAMADHRLPLRPSHALAFLQALAAKVGVSGVSGGNLPAGVDEKFMGALAGDLMTNRGAAVVVPGFQHDPAVHAMCHAINEAIGANGPVVKLTEPVLPKPVGCLEEIKALAGDIEAGRVNTLFILGGNPAYNAPADLKMAELIKKVEFSAHLASHKDETGELCRWELPQSHFLEAWGDATAYDGTMTVIQPLIEPIYDSKSVLEVVDHLNADARGGMAIIQDHWMPNLGGSSVSSIHDAPIDFGRTQPDTEGVVLTQINPVVDPKSKTVMLSPAQADWNTWLATGARPSKGIDTVNPSVVSGLAGTTSSPENSSGLDIMFLPDPTVYDGRYANNPWLQELPKPITNMTWDNAFYVSFETAVKLNLERKEIIGTQELHMPELGFGRPVAQASRNGMSVKAAAATNLGQADDTIVFHMGYGRTKGGGTAIKKDQKEGGGFNAFALQTSDAPTIATGVELSRVDKEYYVMANVQFHNALETTDFDSGREIIQDGTLEKFLSSEPLKEAKEHGNTPEENGETPEEHSKSLYWAELHDHSEDNYQWAMTIDLALCNGCGACVAACQAENNIPTVGKVQVQRGREMHWIRIDRYYMGQDHALDKNNPPIRFQPMTCQQCENAPCEPVCPVAATVHSKEGLNQMVYNRCIGTRYCSNNCPYKVRRFNFLHFTKHIDDIPVLQMLQNPDVTVRYRGVMEKCTYCVQRINHARIDAKKDGRQIHDGEITTACQQACPSKAIIFGDKRRPENAVAKTRVSKRNYVVLEDTNTLPRTTYLMRITNPNPELAG
jgi:molybdopterin-containing oxidoreductase family iron-sulfur binding subunit